MLYAKDLVKKRCNLLSMLDTLTAIGEGIEKPTRISYKANLSWDLLESSLQKLEKKSLIDNVRSKTGERRYYPTEKGKEAVQEFQNLLRMCQ